MNEARDVYPHEYRETGPDALAGTTSCGGRVTASRGTVTLFGRVSDDGDREEAARRIRTKGSHDVVEKIDVADTGEEEAYDTMTAAAAGEALLPYLDLANDEVSIRVEKGWVELEGEVENYQLRQTLDQVVRSLCGVEGLTNSLNVRSSVSVEQLKTQVSQALNRVTRTSAAV